MTLEFQPYKDEHFSAQAAWDGTRLNLYLRGNAELEVNERLGPILAQIHKEARRLGAKEVAVDMGHLQFMNSSCFKQLVTWLNEAQRAPPERYTIRFLANPKVRWQRASLAALSCFAPDLVKIENVAEGA